MIIDGELEEVINDVLYAPKEVVSFFKKFTCPICNSHLETEELTYIQVEDSYVSYADCREDALHYEVNVSWKDPKKIILLHEEVQFLSNETEYTIKKSNINGKVLNDITITPLDDEKKSTTMWLPGNIFNFKKFSQENIVNRIKVLQAFS